MTQSTPRIHVLADEVARQIAAGEVVERPSAVVKELVENAIDAGSTVITVEIEEGGRAAIRVSDNGCGMAREDVPLAFVRHATSKLASLEDLYRISHMGFRGEALYSIAAVARVELTTKRREDAVGVRAVNEGGQLGPVSDAGCPDGTTVWVRDLFYNTPARLKFLRSAQAEAGAVGSVMSRLILANPSISFRFISHGKTVYHSTGDGSLRNAVFTVLGKQIAAHTVEVRGEENGIRVEGCVGEPTVSRGNRSYEMLYVNGRPVNHPAVSRAVENAYGTSLMSQKFPVFVLNLTMPYEWVDVNVHPNKLQVRFAQEQTVFLAVNACVRRALSRVEQRPVEMSFRPARQPETAPPVSAPPAAGTAPAARREVPVPSFREDLPAPVPRDERPAPPAPGRVSAAAGIPPESRDRAAVRDMMEEYRAEVMQKPQDPFSYGQLLEGKKESVLRQHLPSAPRVVPTQTEMEGVRLPQGRIIGTAFSTYALLEAGEELFFVDQHAAHERLLYDKFTAQLEQGQVISQQLLIPQMLEVTYHQRQIIEENMALFTRLGYELESFGRNSFQIRAVPQFMGQAQKSSFFTELLDALGEQPGNGRDERQRAIMQLSCKSAVKGGDALTQPEIDQLLELLRREETPLSCPHGRPICVRLSRRELEKQFKRVL